MKIAVVGTGYVGLVTGTCFAETGNNVTCIDIDAEKVKKLQNGIITIFEPGLEVLFERNIKQGRLVFTTNLKEGIEDAKKNLIKIPLMHGTIPHEQLSKEGAAKVFIKPAAHGTGVIAGGSMRAVLEAAGITDVLAKNLGSANPTNVVKATFKALATLREPIAVAKTRGISLKKVFNG